MSPAPEPPPVSPAVRAGEPLVSVVVPCHGEGRYLGDCLASVTRQTHHHLEILVIDDAGTDDSLAIALAAAAADPRIEVLRTARNVGLGAVRNIATRLARGDLVQYLDGDDFLASDAIEQRVRSLAGAIDGAAGEADAIAGAYGDWKHVPFDAGRDHPAGDCRRIATIDLAASRGGNVFIVSAPLVRREVVLASGGFPEGVDSGEDHLAWLRILGRGMVFVPSPHVVAFYRQKPISMLREGGATIAAFTIAGRRWVAARDGVPAFADAGLERLRRGDVVMRWGRPQRHRARLAGRHPGPSPGRSAPTQAPGPEGLDPGLAAEVSAAIELLERPPPPVDVPVWQFARRSGGQRVTVLAGGVLVRPGHSRAAPSAVLAATDLASGFVAVSAAALLSAELGEIGVRAGGEARRGAVLALGCLRVAPEGLVLLPGDPGTDDIAVGDRLDAGSPLVAAARHLARSCATGTAEGSVVVVVPDVDDAYSWWRTEAERVRSQGRAVAGITLRASLSRRLADQATPLPVGDVAMLADAAAVITAAGPEAALAALANDAVAGADSPVPVPGTGAGTGEAPPVLEVLRAIGLAI